MHNVRPGVFRAAPWDGPLPPFNIDLCPFCFGDFIPALTGQQ